MLRTFESLINGEPTNPTADEDFIEKVANRVAEKMQKSVPQVQVSQNSNEDSEPVETEES